MPGISMHRIPFGYPGQYPGPSTPSDPSCGLRSWLLPPRSQQPQFAGCLAREVGLRGEGAGPVEAVEPGSIAPARPAHPALLLAQQGVAL